jgi:signal transduction histidine kinase/ActR/RegA family two-component response regulator
MAGCPAQTPVDVRMLKPSVSMPRSMRSYLLMLTLGAMVPVLLFTGWLLVHLMRKEMIGTLGRLSDAAALLSESLDREFDVIEATLATLAVNPVLATGDLAAFHALARTIPVDRVDRIAIADSSGKLILDTSRPFGVPNPDIRFPHLFEPLFRSGAANVVSNIIPGDIADRPVMIVTQPVFILGERHALAIAVYADRFQKLIARVPSTLHAVIADGDGVVAAHTPGTGSAAGPPLAPSLLALLRAGSSGQDRLLAADGKETFAAFQRSPQTQWVVLIREPTERLWSQIRDLAVTYILIGLLFVAAAIGAASWFSRRLTRSMRDLAHRAALLGDGAMPGAASAPTVAEIALVQQQLMRASDLVAARTREAMVARAQAEKANAAKSEFLAHMSHELRTPLNAIIGVADLLMESDPTEDQRQCLNLQIDAGQTLLGIVNEILDYSKIEAGKLDLEATDFDLRRLIDDSVALVADQARSKGLLLEAIVAPDVPGIVCGDPTRLRQVLLNLMTNGIKFTDVGRVTLAVSRLRDRATGMGGAGMALRFVVADSGIGIPLERRDRLFQSFSQVDSSTTRRYGGTGLGLVISKRLVEAMGGKIGVDSTVGLGSTFWFEITFQHATEAAPAPVTGQILHRAAIHILVVDNIAVYRHLAVTMLAAAGYWVDAAADGARAIEAARRSAYHLILMDVRMPGPDIRETVATLRAIDGWAESVPIVGLIADGSAGETEDAWRAAGMDDRLMKPFSKPDLLNAVERWVVPATPIAEEICV